MTDVVTKKPLLVEIDQTVGPYLRLGVSQLEAIRQMLDQHNIHYRVDEYAISFNGAPETTLIYFGRKGNAQTVQAILDSVS